MNLEVESIEALRGDEEFARFAELRGMYNSRAMKGDCGWDSRVGARSGHLRKGISR